VKTTRDFIDKVASISGTSDKLYLIRYEAGKEIKSQEFLLAELGRLEKAVTKTRASGHFGVRLRYSNRSRTIGSQRR